MQQRKEFDHLVLIMISLMAKNRLNFGSASSGGQSANYRYTIHYTSNVVNS